MTFPRLRIRETNKTIVKYEIDIDTNVLRVTSSVIDKSELASVVLEIIIGGHVSESLSLPPDRLRWLQGIGDAICKTLEELEKILPSED